MMRKEDLKLLIKINWLFLKNLKGSWFSSKIFRDGGGINFLLKCDFDLNELPIKLSGSFLSSFILDITLELCFVVLVLQ